ncbi:hypothetical protein SpiGrapes_2178 [Sphaerochaeta pleomorpha str. Grapes]|uniref:Capsule assembly protein Wzi n=1 Tax=Sphaerochaeta pleomorpha (strain ATCC BAA-1885 / DSM 22778 / Grapes) TaxID=158190 RepID=G8QRN2_SPHPG|nr:hypothetical protein [Sphaerochaeta pleomorpha]AEV29954.1 hypothetical protein SpiGrapes_2178 [Sphaerochaeta pleomorpha str. Grapes]
MKIRRFLFSVLITVLVSSVVFAAPYANKQKIFSLDSDVYEAIASLYVIQGLSLPSTTGPYSEAELLMMLEKVDTGRLNGATKATYDYIASQLDVQPKMQTKGMGLSWNFDANLETYTHTNTTEFTGRENWNRGYISQKPLLSVGLETWPSESFYGYSELSIGNTYTLENAFGSIPFSTNLIILSPATLMDLDFNIPYRAFVAMGGDGWTFQLGRDRMSWGAGESGNLMMGDNLKYHNMARYTAFGEKYKYTFVTSFFPHPSSYLGGGDGAVVGDGQEDILSGLNMFMAHRLEWRMFSDKVGLALTESIMYQSEENLLDLRVLNPAMIFHDNYIRSNSNSLLGLELDYTPVKGVNLYGQAVVDEFSLPGEPVPSATEVNYPVTFGYLAGVKAVAPIGNLMGHASLEFAYTDPFLYLRYQTKNDASATSGDAYSLNFVGTIREFTNKDGTRYNAEFIGYEYGGDALVFNLNGGVKKYGKWNVEANGFFMLHGTFDIYTMWSRVGGSSGVPYDISTPTTDHPTGNYNDPTAQATRDSVSQTLVVGVSGSYEITPCLKAFGQVDYIHIGNYGNVSGTVVSDVQLTLGVTYHI